MSGGQDVYLLGDLRVTVLTRGAETEGRHDLVQGVDRPGSCTPLHLHTRYDERLWVTAGAMTVWAGHDEVTIGTGGFYAIPMNVPHMIQAGPEGASALVISSPAAFAELIERTATPAHLATAATEMDMELFMRVSTELGDVVLGPPGTTPAEIGWQPQA